MFFLTLMGNATPRKPFSYPSDYPEYPYHNPRKDSFIHISLRSTFPIPICLTTTCDSDNNITRITAKNGMSSTCSSNNELVILGSLIIICSNPVHICHLIKHDHNFPSKDLFDEVNWPGQYFTAETPYPTVSPHPTAYPTETLHPNVAGPDSDDNEGFPVWGIVVIVLAIVIVIGAAGIIGYVVWKNKQKRVNNRSSEADQNSSSHHKSSSSDSPQLSVSEPHHYQ